VAPRQQGHVLQAQGERASRHRHQQPLVRDKKTLDGWFQQVTRARMDRIPQDAE
jgi:hypothetical protein